MAKMFYSAKEAAAKLGKSEEDLKGLVRAGKLREFRDAGSVNYKVEDVDKLASGGGGAAKKSSPGASASGELVLEPAEDSGIQLSPSSSDILSLAEVDADDTHTGTAAMKKKKEGTVVPSVGVNVFDDDELAEHVDPLAQTAVTDVAGLGLEGIGSGSGILDLTRESDDTSLGAELLEEIYTDEDTGTVEMGEATRAGLDEAISDERPEPAEVFSQAEPAVAGTRGVARTVIEYGPDAASSSLTAVMAVAVLVMWFAGLAAAALARGVAPSLLSAIYNSLWMFALGAVVVSGLAAALTYFVSKRSA
jgi:hypothetical protein